MFWHHDSCVPKMPAATLHRCTKLYLCCARQYSAHYSRWNHAQQHAKPVTTAQLNTNPWHLSEWRMTIVTWQFCTWLCLNSLMHERERDSTTSLSLGNGLVDSKHTRKTKHLSSGCKSVWFSCVKCSWRVHLRTSSLFCQMDDSLFCSKCSSLSPCCKPEIMMHV